MQWLRTVIAVSDGSGTVPTLAAAQVLSTLLGINKLILKNEDICHSMKLPSESVILFAEIQVRALSALRLHGFSGAVLVLSHQPFESLHKKHQILTYGISSHNAWEYPWELPDLLAKVAKLKPLRAGNQQILKQELKAAAERLDRLLESAVLPHLKQLCEANGYLHHKLDIIKEAVENLWTHTPSARHTIIELEGYGKAAIQTHFQNLTDEIRDSQGCNERQIMLLQQVLEEWRNLVREFGEDIEAFS